MCRDGQDKQQGASTIWAQATDSGGEREGRAERERDREIEDIVPTGQTSM